MKAELQTIVSAQFSGAVQLANINVRGRILTPGPTRPMVNGKPATVHWSRDVIVAAYDDLRARIDAGKVEMRLSHPGTGDMPVKWGLAKEVLINRERGDVWLVDSEPYPEMKALLTEEAQAKLSELGLSIHASVGLRARLDANGKALKDEYDCTRFTIEAIDIVSAGAFSGSGITEDLPADLAAQATNPPQAEVGSGDRGQAPATKESGTMPTLETIDQIPADVRELLGDDKKAQTYLEAYNAAIAAGKSPVEAAEAAMSAATRASAAAKATPKEKKPMTKPPEDGAQPDADLTARLAAKDDELQKLSARVATAEKTAEANGAAITELKAKNTQLEAERDAILVQKDVEWAIVSARKATPAEKATLITVRQKLGSEDFRHMISARTAIAIPLGERGGVNAAANDGVLPNEAAEVLAKYGLKETIAMGLHRSYAGTPIVPGLAELLAKDHASDPLVRTHLRRELATLNAKKAGA